MASRIDTVFIRKSTREQDDTGQKRNVENMLKEQGIHVPDRYWFACTVPRSKVQANAEFARLMGLIEADKVGTVYIESQDRWGTGNVAELFRLLSVLSDHGTCLYDLRDKTDLTCKDDATEMRAFLGGLKSKKERQDLAFRSLRTRVSNFKDSGSWPTGTHPFGYGKRCYSAEGKLLWEWQPVNRSRGQIFYPDAAGQMTPGPANIRIPRKNKGAREKTVLVPSNNPKNVKAVRLIFDLYTRVGLSRRQIAARLNAEGLTFNGGPFTHPDVTNILENPAYAGDTHFGKVQTGAFQTFDGKGLLSEVTKKRDSKRRHVQDRLVKENTHSPLVDRKTWELAQKKLAAERERTSFAPRNPAYFLKQLFVCGHCGKGLTGRTETDPTTKKKTVIYVCPTYIAGRCNGHPASCGYQRITHADAERLLLDKIAELNLPFDEAPSEGARANLQDRLAQLGHADKESAKQWQRWVTEGIDALADHLAQAYPQAADWPEIQKLRKLAFYWYWHDLDEKPDDYHPFGGLPVAIADLRRAVQEAEATAVGKARHKLAELREEHKTLTLAWAKASELQQAVLKGEVERLEAEIHEWGPRAVPLSERFNALNAAEAERQAERERLLAEWPTLENREKGEALRRLFSTVTLFWERTFHPASKTPTRPRKTDRPGRFRYTLRRDRIRWAFATSDLGGSW